jgi:hypothetical protein
VIIERARFAFCFTLNRARSSHALWLQIHLPNFLPIYVSHSNKVLEGRHTQLLKLFGGNCSAKLSHAALSRSAFETRMPRNLFWRGSNRIAERKFRSSQLRYWYFSPGILLWRRRLRWTGRVVCMGEKNANKILVGKPDGMRPVEKTWA